MNDLHTINASIKSLGEELTFTIEVDLGDLSGINNLDDLYYYLISTREFQKTCGRLSDIINEIDVSKYTGFDDSNQYDDKINRPLILSQYNNAIAEAKIIQAKLNNHESEIIKVYIEQEYHSLPDNFSIEFNIHVEATIITVDLSIEDVFDAYGKYALTSVERHIRCIADGDVDYEFDATDCSDFLNFAALTRDAASK